MDMNTTTLNLLGVGELVLDNKNIRCEFRGGNRSFVESIQINNFIFSYSLYGLLRRYSIDTVVFLDPTVWFASENYFIISVTSNSNWGEKFYAINRHEYDIFMRYFATYIPNRMDASSAQSDFKFLILKPLVNWTKEGF
jgi:hypothetical protein